MSYLDIARAQLPIDEGRKTKPYPDTMGKLTIGVGHNLTDDGLSDPAVDFIFAEDLAVADVRVRQIVPNFDALSDGRKAVLVNMTFNLGWGLRAFRKMLAAVEAGDWATAAEEMKNSDWARQVGARAARLERQMLDG